MPLNQALSPASKSAIQAAYTRFLKARELGSRQGQKLMIATIARTLGGIQLNDAGQRVGENHVCVVEAGTGTGKTVAYLIASIPLALERGKKVVISTATIALQEQIVVKDLPEILRHSGLDFSFGLAKGRGRYLCLSKLDNLLATDDQGQASLLTEYSGDPFNLNMRLYAEMMEALSLGRWDGDRDNWPRELPAQDWQPVTTDHRQCTGRRCSFVRQCAFFRARESLEDLDVIVANHDLVLADLALGGGAILPDPAETFYIFDEGHHLPEKARNHFAVHTRLVATSRWLGQTEGLWPRLIEPMQVVPGFMSRAARVEPQLKEARRLLDNLQPSIAAFMPVMDRSGMVTRYRFPEGTVPASIEAAAADLASTFAGLHKLFEALVAQVNELLEDPHGPVDRSDLEAIFPQLGTWLARFEANSALWQSYSSTAADPDWPVARWITLVEQGDTVDFELVACPVLASRTLTDLLWDRCCGAVVTSATLTALGSFDRFRDNAGTPEGAIHVVVPSPFDFTANGRLRLPRAAVDGNQVAEHTESIVRLLPEIIDEKSAVLTLFSSRRQMLDVFEALPERWQSKILKQGEDSRQLLLQRHRERVDAGQGSILFGLASFAEGVDLPGRYCDHVIIAKIPFAVPDDPVEAAMAEWIEASGGNAFMQMSVPDAAIRLVQACGRLLRTESDSGVVTLLDRRIVSKRYGRAILDTLPAFRRELNHD